MEKKYISADKLETIKCDMYCQETTVNYYRDEDIARLFTSDNTMVTKMKHMMERSPENYKCYEGSRDSDGNMTGYFFEFPKKLISFRTGTDIDREFTDEQKEAARERFKQYWADKRDNTKEL